MTLPSSICVSNVPDPSSVNLNVIATIVPVKPNPPIVKSKISLFHFLINQAIH